MSAIMQLLASTGKPADVIGQVAYTTAGTYSWTCPANVTSVCAVCVGAGASLGGGGGLGWKNNIPTVPSNNYTVVVGAGGVSFGAGGDSYFISTSDVCGFGGKAINGGNATFVGDGGGNGGASTGWAGAGAGGYTGAGGNAGAGGSGSTGQAGSGGGGGGGSFDGVSASGGGGGVGIFGQGSNGTGSYGNNAGGGGGSGGTNGMQGASGAVYGGLYGGASGYQDTATEGAGGAVRLIWGSGRAFPTTRTGDE